MNLAELTTRMHAIRDHNDWRPAEHLAHAGQEIGDVILYLVLLCGELGLDMEQVVRAKLADNERRFLGSASNE